MRTSLVLAALVAGLSGIGGTGNAASHAALFADVADTESATGSSDRCNSVMGVDHTACRQLAASWAEANRNATLGALSKDWRGPRLAAFVRLVAAEKAFAHALAANESGAAPSSTDAADAERAQNDGFVATLQRLVAGRLSREEASVQAADEALNDAYGRVMKVDDTRELGWGDVEKAGILRTERAWIAYRDAFAAFASTLDSPDAADTIRCELTRQRTASLDSFLGD